VQVDVDLTGTLPAGARADLSVDGTIQIEHMRNVLFVGRPALALPNSDVQLFRLDPVTSTAEKVPLHVGRSSSTLIEITKGLREGDKVILSDMSEWDAYKHIRIN
jgi:HlyD family secretion protein